MRELVCDFDLGPRRGSLIYKPPLYCQGDEGSGSPLQREQLVA